MTSVEPDTSFALNIDGKKHILTLPQNEMMSKADSSRETITARIIGAEANQVLFVETYEFNRIDGLQTPANGKYWLTLVSTGGGAGFSGTAFQVQVDPEVRLLPILNFDELTPWKINKKGTGAIVFRGIWNMNAEDENAEPESHFSEHQQSITEYAIEMDAVLEYEIGLTAEKCDFYEDKSYSAFRKAEPALAEKIEWSEFE